MSDRADWVRVGDGVVEDLPDGRRSGCGAEAGEFAVDAPVAQAGLSRAMSSARSRTLRGQAGVQDDGGGNASGV